MGVRGLTKYIATKAEKYLDPHELHDCDLVIDGDNLASQLFRKSDGGLSAFGGNYDTYFREVVAFFNLLKKCNVRAFVLMDGGYEHKKMRTTKERLLGRIGVIKSIIPLDSRSMAIPLLMRECFVDAVKSCNVKFMRCYFEADNEIAVLAKKLKCPVLSYDSDFYIFDGLYIPYVTVTHQIHKKTIISKNSYEVEILRKRPKGQKNWKKATKKFLVEDPVTDQSNDKSASVAEETKTYNYLDCCIYTVENLTEGQLDKEMLPLFATLIGNDFVHKNVFNKFLMNVRRKFNKKYSPQQKRILKIMDFLKNETLKSAITKIMGHMKTHQRANLLERIKYAMSGYCIEKSEAFDYFGLEKEFPHIENNDGYEFDLDELLASSDEESDEEDHDDPAENDEDDDDEEAEGEAESDEDVSDENDEEASEEQKENSDEGSNKNINSESGSESEFLDDENSPFSRRKFVFPEWFEKRYKAGTVPRFVCDIFRFRRYINYPQVEEFDRPDSNQIAYPLLKLIFGLLNKSKTDHMLYYTRIPRKIRFDVQIFENDDAIEDFDPTIKKNVKYLEMVFRKKVKDCDMVFERIYEVPEPHQLFILAVVFWMNRAPRADVCFLMATLLSLMALNIVDKKSENLFRNQHVFMKKYKKYLDDQKTALKEVPETESSEKLEAPKVSQILRSIPKEISKSEALLAVESFVGHYSISAKMERKHADFKREVVHTFAELQAIIFNLNAINPILNFPFENVKIGNYFNGLFLYNMYNSLRIRADPLKYVKTNVLNNSPNLLKYFTTFLNFCLELLPNVKLDQANVEPQKKSKKAKINRTKKPTIQHVSNDCLDQPKDEVEEEFNDLNNKFNILLNIK